MKPRFGLQARFLVMVAISLALVAAALGVLLLRQHLDSFPKELLEASAMDGRSSWTTLWTVVELSPLSWFFPTCILPLSNNSL